MLIFWLIVLAILLWVYVAVQAENKIPINSKEEYEIKERMKITIFAVILIGISLLFLYFSGATLSSVSLFSSDDASRWGQFGDFIGGILNPIVGICTLYWVISSVRTQRAELKDTKNALQEGNAAQLKRSFEETFFALLNQHNQILFEFTSINTRNGNGTPNSEYIKQFIFSQQRKNLKEAKDFLQNFNNKCGHYYRILYQLLKFIRNNCHKSFADSSNFNENELRKREKFYSNIVRAFLNYDVTQILAVNCYAESSEDTYWDFKKLIERYAFLEHMPFKIVTEQKTLDEEDLNEILLLTLEHYDAAAFGNSNFVKERTCT